MNNALAFYALVYGLGALGAGVMLLTIADWVIQWWKNR